MYISVNVPVAVRQASMLSKELRGGREGEGGKKRRRESGGDRDAQREIITDFY